MVEAALIDPHVGAPFHQLVHVVETAVGGEWDVAVGGNHEFHLHASLQGPLQGALDAGRQGEVGVDELDAVAGVVEGADAAGDGDVVQGRPLPAAEAHIPLPDLMAQLKSGGRYEILARYRGDYYTTEYIDAFTRTYINVLKSSLGKNCLLRLYIKLAMMKDFPDDVAD